MSYSIEFHDSSGNAIKSLLHGENFSLGQALGHIGAWVTLPETHPLDIIIDLFDQETGDIALSVRIKPDGTSSTWAPENIFGSRA